MTGTLPSCPAPRIIKGLPVIACGSCSEYLIADDIMGRVDQFLARVDQSAELEIVRFVA